jgi:hypothetical protein
MTICQNLVGSAAGTRSGPRIERGRKLLGKVRLGCFIYSCVIIWGRCALRSLNGLIPGSRIYSFVHSFNGTPLLSPPISILPSIVILLLPISKFITLNKPSVSSITVISVWAVSSQDLVEVIGATLIGLNIKTKPIEKVQQWRRFSGSCDGICDFKMAAFVYGQNGESSTRIQTSWHSITTGQTDRISSSRPLQAYNVFPISAPRFTPNSNPYTY